MCVCVFPSCEITSKTKMMIVVTEAWMRCIVRDRSHCFFLQISFLFQSYKGKVRVILLAHNTPK